MVQRVKHFFTAGEAS